MAIRVYNTLSRQKEVFESEDEHVNIYVCGVTPYDETHLGHARPSVIWDVIKKYLRWQGYSVYHVQNFTDIDDKIIARALEEEKSATQVANFYIKDYLEGMAALGIEEADAYPKVSEHIPEIIQLVSMLIEKQHAYAINGNVFFDVVSFPEYGKLSNQKLDQLQAGTRFEVDPDKRNPMDFALWKAAKPGEPAWDSPWGKGRPGWHIECSAMSQKYLGSSFDFHGGGSDLVFPHHENEIAQSEAATGKPLAKYWLHNGMLNLKNSKMSKSEGNFVTVRQVLAEYPKELVRFYILSNHYRSELEFHDTKLMEVERGWSRFNDFVKKIASLVKDKKIEKQTLENSEARLLVAVEETEKQFIAAMNDDFNTALAIATLYDLQHHVNNYLAENATSPQGDYVLQKVYELFCLLAGDILGVLKLDEPRATGLTEPLMELILHLRTELRKEQNYNLADIIRDRLDELNILVEDTPQGPRWKTR